MKIDCRQAQKMAGAFAEDDLSDRDLAALLAHVKNCSSCYEELKTSYLISYALQYMDHDKNGSLDTDALMKEKVRKSELRLQRHRIMSILLWIAIVLLGILIAAIIIRILFPNLLPELTNLINEAAAFLPLGNS